MNCLWLFVFVILLLSVLCVIVVLLFSHNPPVMNVFLQ